MTIYQEEIGFLSFKVDYKGTKGVYYVNPGVHEGLPVLYGGGGMGSLEGSRWCPSQSSVFVVSGSH